MTGTLAPVDSGPRQRQLDRLVDAALDFYRAEAVGGKIARRQVVGILSDLDSIITFDRDARRTLKAQAVTEIVDLVGVPAGPLAAALSEAGLV